MNQMILVMKTRKQASRVHKYVCHFLLLSIMNGLDQLVLLTLFGGWWHEVVVAWALWFS